MKNRVDYLINDFFYDVDSVADSRQLADTYADDSIVMNVFGDTYKGKDGFIAWYDSLKAGFSEFYHQVKSVEITEKDAKYQAVIKLVWIAGFRNMGDKNKIKYDALVNCSFINDGTDFKISSYVIKAV